MSGAVLGQAILLLALPLLTRIYSPEDFNTLAVYVAIVGIFAGAICLRFDIAISIPDSEEESRKLLLLAIFCAALLSLLVSLGVWLAGDVFDIDYGLDNGLFAALVGVGLFAIGAFNSFQVWYIKSRQFMTISFVRFAQALVSVLVQIGIGLGGAKAVGLLIGYIASSGLGSFAFMLSFFRRNAFTDLLSVREIRALFRRYGRFPKYSALESLANEGASQLPVLLIAFLLGGAEAGFLMLAMRVLQAPIGLVGNAVSQVYLSRAPEAERKGELAGFSLEMLTRLAKIGIGPLILGGVLAPTAFPIIFGEEWARAGELISWMTPWFILQFLVSPVSMSLHVKGRQDAALYLQVSSFLIRVFAVVIFYFLSVDFMVEAYALSGFVSYFIYLVVVLKVLQVSPKVFVKSLMPSVPLVAGCSVLAVVLLCVLREFYSLVVMGGGV
ncbi:Polysaccharide biosynthesis protein [Pseudomonas sp. JV241A]|nr:Polysaccharide biosynthesis protein [Pseudomonas sp. JV241A]